MEILTVNAEVKLSNLATSISRDLLSWKSWKALHISLSGVPDEIKPDALIWARSVFDAYFGHVRGRVFYCHDEDLWFICKGLDPDVLRQGAYQICELVEKEAGLHCGYHIYDITSDGYSFAEDVFSKMRSNVSLCVSRISDLGIGIRAYSTNKNFDAGGRSKTIKNYHEYAKVMLVEDDPVTRWMVRNSLKNECQFAAAPCANQAFSMYSNFQPDLVFLDINLPDKSGYDVLEWIVRNDPGAKVVMFSSNDDLDNICNAMEEGASGFIAKPFLKESLLYYIRNTAGARMAI